MSKFQERYLQILNESPYVKAFARPGVPIKSIQYYNYNLRIGSDAAPLLLNTPQNGTIETQADSDFIMTYLSAGALVAATGFLTFNRNILVQIQDQSTGKFFFNQATIMGLIAGAGGFPYVFPAPRVIAPNVNIVVTATNRDSTVNFTGIFLSFHGTRIFYGS